MARSSNPRPLPLSRVQPGDVFALTLDDGRWGACRILGKASDPSRLAVQALGWVGDAPPNDLSNPLFATPLRMTHHEWAGQTYELWVTEPLPPDAVRLGRLPLSAEDTALTPVGWAVWAAFRTQPLLQWRWDHDRDAVLAEDALTQQQQFTAELEARQGYVPHPAKSLQELRQQKLLAGWTGYHEPDEVRLARRILRDLLDDLIALEDSGTEASRFDAFRRAVERFNEDDFDIDTVDREDLCDFLHDVADVVGLTDYDVAAWRDW